MSFDSVRLSFDSVRFSPLMSVLIVSLYVRGGTSRTAALLLLAISAIALLRYAHLRSITRTEDFS